MKKEHSATLNLIEDRKIEPSRAIPSLTFLTELIEFEIDTVQEYCSAKIDNADTRSGIELDLRDIKFSVGLINKSIEFCATCCARISSMDTDHRYAQRDILLDMCAVQANNIRELLDTLHGVCETMAVEGRYPFYGATGLAEQ